MGIYIVGFTLSTLLFASYPKVARRQRWFIAFVALLIPCLIAGLRAETIGTDVRVYLVQMTEAAESAGSFREYIGKNWYMQWRYVFISDYEIGFSLLVYAVEKVFGSILAVQFFIQAFTVFPVYFALKQFKGKYPLSLCMLTYYLMLFNSTLNMMRQSIAMAFVLLAFAYLLNKRKKSCLLCVVIALLFHKSSLLCVLIFAIYWFVNLASNNLKLGKIIPKKNVNMVFAILAGIIMLLAVKGITALLSLFGFSKYLGYISGTIRFMPNQLISRLPAFVLFLYTWKKLDANEDNLRFFFTMLCFDLLCSQFSSVNPFGVRIALYFSLFSIISYPSVYIAANKNKVTLVLLVAYMVFFWWFYFVHSGTHQTMPYLFGF